MDEDKTDSRIKTTDDPVISALGMTIPSKEPENNKVNGSESTALALPGHVGTVKSLVTNLLQLSAIVTGGDQKAHNKMRERLVVQSDGVSPQIIPIEFEGQTIHRTDKGVRKVIDVRISSTVHLSGYGEVEVVPLIVVGINYIVNDNGWLRSNGTFHCIVFKPKNDKGPFKVLPVGLADPSILSRWNRIVDDLPERKWPHIEPISHNLNKNGTRRITLPVGRMWSQTYKETIRFGPEKGKQKHKEVYFIGSIFGKKIQLDDRSQSPPPAKIEGNGQYVYTGQKHVFRIRLLESSIVATWLGREKDVQINECQMDVDVKSEFDPFAVLGTNIMRFNPDRVEKHTAMLLRRDYDLTNPLYDWALQLGRIESSDSCNLVGPILSDLAREAVVKALDCYKTKLADVWSKLSRVPGMPSAEVMLAGNGPNVVRGTPDSEDAVVCWLNSVIDGEYNHRSHFHRTIRSWVINFILKKDGYVEKQTESKKASKKSSTSGRKKVSAKKTSAKKPNALKKKSAKKKTSSSNDASPTS